MSGQHTFDELCGIMDTLLSENGCPWDRAQTHESLREGFVEEVYEVVDAINKKDARGLCEELGDVLFSVVFHGKLAERDGEFTLSDVIGGVAEKMVRRHPHIFTDETKADTPDDVLENWDQIKKAEKSYTTGAQYMRAAPEALPALMRAEKVVKRAEKAGMEKPSAERCLAEIRKLTDCLEASVNSENEAAEEAIFTEIGKLLFSTVAISRKLNINAEFALTNALETFINKFEDCENAMKSTSDTLWL